MRSQNPDLLLPEVMNERVKRISDFWSGLSELDHQLDRMTIFVTHRCNLLCGYCNGPHVTLREGNRVRKTAMLKNDLTVERFEQMLSAAQESWSVKHIHFTGGEPTLNKDLPAFVKISTSHNILSSITTNGTADPMLYRELIENGLTEIRISFDSFLEENFDSKVGVSGSFQKIVNAIGEIVRLRDQGNDVFLVINACVDGENIDHIEKTVEFLIRLNPNDIKLLVVAQDREIVQKHKNGSTTNRLKKLLTEYPDEQFILLREKIDNLFDQDAVGLLDKETQTTMKHCFVPITERTIDGSHYYPCSIYLRYYGEPIGPITDSFDLQQIKIMDFVSTHDCRQDPICSNHCTTCCKVFNIRTNQDLTVETCGAIEIDSSVSSSEVESTIEELHNLIRSGQPGNKAFLVIKPHGQRWREEILALLQKNGLEVESIARLKKWEECAKFIYIWPPTLKEARFTLQKEKAFSTIEKGPADVIYFKNNPTAELLCKMKYKIRGLFPTKRYQLNISGEKRWIRLTAVHTPDAADIMRETTILSSLLKK